MKFTVSSVIYLKKEEKKKQSLRGTEGNREQNTINSSIKQYKSSLIYIKGIFLFVVGKTKYFYHTQNNLRNAMEHKKYNKLCVRFFFFFFRASLKDFKTYKMRDISSWLLCKAND